MYNINTNVSDIDIGGVYIAPIEYILGFRDRYRPQISDERGDTVFFELGKWLELLCTSNPNALESLYIPEDKIIGAVHPAVMSVIENRDMFLTKQCFKPFFYYAAEQIKRARGLNKKIVNPVYERKGVLDFCYTINKQGSILIEKWLSSKGLKQEYCGLAAIPNMRDLYGLYYDWGADYYHAKTDETERNRLISAYSNLIGMSFDESANDLMTKRVLGYKGIVKRQSNITNESNEVRLSSIEKDVLPLCVMSYNKDGYICHCKEYREYKEWETKRNKVRYESNLNKNYDSKNMCHTIRLLHMAYEIAVGDGFNVVRTWDREFLMDIRNHKFEYDYIIDYAEAFKDKTEKAMTISKLPESVDKDKVNSLLIDVRKIGL